MNLSGNKVAIITISIMLLSFMLGCARDSRKSIKINDLEIKLPPYNAKIFDRLYDITRAYWGSDYKKITCNNDVYLVWFVGDNRYFVWIKLKVFPATGDSKEVNLALAKVIESQKTTFVLCSIPSDFIKKYIRVLYDETVSILGAEQFSYGFGFSYFVWNFNNNSSLIITPFGFKKDKFHSNPLIDQ